MLQIASQVLSTNKSVVQPVLQSETAVESTQILEESTYPVGHTLTHTVRYRYNPLLHVSHCPPIEQLAHPDIQVSQVLVLV